MTPAADPSTMNLLVLAAFVITVALEILVPVALGFLIAKRLRVPGNLFFAGLAFFIGVQVVHIPLVLLTQAPLTDLMEARIAEPGIRLALLGAYLGLLAGIFEECGRYLAYTRFFPKDGLPCSRENALMFGAGWGGAECMLIGLLVALSMVSYLAVFLAPGSVLPGGSTPSEAAVAALAGLTPVDVLYGLSERMLTLILQIALSLLVMLAVQRKAPLLLGLAIAWHAVLDFLAVFVAGTYGIPATEAMLVPFALAGLAFILWAWPRMAGGYGDSGTAPAGQEGTA